MAVADVEPVGAEPLGRLLPGVVEHVDGDHPRALAGEPLGMGGALAARPARDERHPPGKPAVGGHRNALPPVAVSVSPVT